MPQVFGNLVPYKALGNVNAAGSRGGRTKVQVCDGQNCANPRCDRAADESAEPAIERLKRGGRGNRRFMASFWAHAGDQKGRCGSDTNSERIFGHKPSRFLLRDPHEASSAMRLFIRSENLRNGRVASRRARARGTRTSRRVAPSYSRRRKLPRRRPGGTDGMSTMLAIAVRATLFNSGAPFRLR